MITHTMTNTNASHQLALQAAGCHESPCSLAPGGFFMIPGGVGFRNAKWDLCNREADMIVNVKDAAKRLGMSRSTLHRLSQQSEFYAPSAQGMCDQETGSKLHGYHEMHLELIEAVRGLLDRHGIEAPLMMVRGDGSLVAAEFALTAPVETILSGPAASLVGACHLSGEPDAVVIDMGGTTSDIGILQQGEPRRHREGDALRP